MSIKIEENKKRNIILEIKINKIILEKLKEIIKKLNGKEINKEMEIFVIYTFFNELIDFLKYQNEKIKNIINKTNLQKNIILKDLNNINTKLNNIYNYECENNFILINEIILQNNIIIFLKKEINKTKKYVNFIDETLIDYNDEEIEFILKDELEKSSNLFYLLNNKEKLIKAKLKKLISQKDKLNKIINKLKIKNSKKLLTENNYLKTEYLLTFNNFENEDNSNNLSEKSNLNESNEFDSIIEEELDLKGNHLLTDPNINKLNDKVLSNNDPIKSNIKLNLSLMPKLNLKQINYNKGKIETEISSKEINEVNRQYKMSKEYKIKRLKRKIEKLKVNINENKNIIKKFMNYLKKMKYYNLLENHQNDILYFDEFSQRNQNFTKFNNYYNYQTEPNINNFI